MSVVQTVFVSKAKLPRREQWQSAISKHGFSVVLHPEFDPATDDGYLPCTCSAGSVGFEYDVEDLDDYAQEQELDEDDLASIKDYDLAVSFSTKGCMKSLDAAIVVAAVLADLTGGRFFEEESGDFIDDPLEMANDPVADA